MEQKSISCGKQFPPLCANNPWLVAQNPDATGDQSFYTIHDQMLHYRSRIPELRRRRIRGYFHGWVILSKNIMWSLWNPSTCKIIHLPPLILKDGDSESIGECCLSSPPYEPNSTLLLTRTAKPTFVFCRLNCKRNELRWTEVSYARQLKKITGYDCLLRCTTFFNGKAYALNTGHHKGFVIQIDIVVTDRAKVDVKLLIFGICPFPSYNRCPGLISFLKGTSTQLFYITVAFNELTKETLGTVYLFKLVMNGMRWEELVQKGLKDFKTSVMIWEESRMMWEEMAEFKDAIFFIDLAHDYSVFYNNAIASEFGGYIHIRGEMGKMLYSFDFEDKTISVSSMPSPTSHLSLWECRIECDHGEAKCTVDSRHEEYKDDKTVIRSVMDAEVESNESRLLNFPLHILEKIMEHCVGVEYMYFRAACKRCHLAAPMIQWGNKAALTRLHNYSVVSPWLMVVDKNRGIITFTDPMFGDKYFMKNLQVLVDVEQIWCSRFGWLLFTSSVFKILVFFNPFTSELRKLPPVRCYLGNLCFSAPPTSPDCMVIGFTVCGEPHIYVHFVAREQSWRMIRLDFGGADPRPFCCPTFNGQDLYVLGNNGELYVFKSLVQEQRHYVWKQVVGARRSRKHNFLVKCDEHMLLVIVGKFGESVEVFKLNAKEWEKVDCLGRYMIYICDTTCLCIEAKRSEMENKIYLPRLHSKKGKIVFYSLETCRFQTFDDENFGFGIGHAYPHAWIEPSWSYSYS